MSELSWPSPFGYSIFCDDVRYEIGGKLSYIGIYTGDLIVMGNFPATLPKFCIVVNYSENPSEFGDNLELTIQVPGDPDEAPSTRIDFQRTINPDASNDIAEYGPDARVAMTTPMTFNGFHLKEEGFIRVRMRRGDDIVRLGSIRVRARPTEETEQDPNRETLPPA